MVNICDRSRKRSRKQRATTLEVSDLKTHSLPVRRVVRNSINIGSHVVGVVTGGSPEYFQLELGSHSVALLPKQSFTDVNYKVRVRLGEVIYAIVSRFNSFGQPVVICPKAIANRRLYGVIEGGIAAKTSRLTHRNKRFWKTRLTRGAELPLQVALGANDLVWISAAFARNSARAVSAVRNTGKTR